jgi:hypothetical protein
VRIRGGHIGWVRVGFDDNDFAAIPPSSVMARLATPERRAEMHAEAPTSQIHEALSKVREAMDRDYQIVVLNDACADPDPDTHAFLTGTIFPRYATVIAVADLHGLWV